MSTIELKGQLLNVIARLDNDQLLRDILEYSVGLAQDVDMLHDLPSETIAELEKAIDESYENENGTPHEEVMEMAEIWLKK